MIDAVVSLLLLLSGALVLTSAIGLIRLREFFLRMHAPALTYTLGAWAVTFASILYFSSRHATPMLHVWLIIILLSITTPVTTVLLARAALFRRRAAGDRLPPPLEGRCEPPQENT